MNKNQISLESFCLSRYGGFIKILFLLVLRVGFCLWWCNFLWVIEIFAKIEDFVSVFMVGFVPLFIIMWGSCYFGNFCEVGSCTYMYLRLGFVSLREPK